MVTASIPGMALAMEKGQLTYSKWARAGYNCLRVRTITIEGLFYLVILNEIQGEHNFN